MSITVGTVQKEWLSAPRNLILNISQSEVTPRLRVIHRQYHIFTIVKSLCGLKPWPHPLLIVVVSIHAPPWIIFYSEFHSRRTLACAVLTTTSKLLTRSIIHVYHSLAHSFIVQLCCSKYQYYVIDSYYEVQLTTAAVNELLLWTLSVRWLLHCTALTSDNNLICRKQSHEQPFVPLIVSVAVCLAESGQLSMGSIKCIM